MEATSLSSHSLHFNLLRAKPFRNQGGLVVHNLQFNHPLYARTYLSLKSNGSRSVRRHSLLLRTPLTSERDKRFSVHCSDQLQSNHLNVEAKPVHSSRSEYIPPAPDAVTNELNSMDISEVKDLQTRPGMFRNNFLDFVRMGSAFNDAAESFFKSEIRRRLFVTVVLIVMSRIGYFIPLPGFDRRLVPKDYLSFISGTVDKLVDSPELLKLSLFQLGISPQIGASIFMQVLCQFVPSLALLRKKGLRGYEKIKSYIWWVSLAIAIMEGFLVATYSLPYSIYAANHRIWHVMVTTALMVFGSMFMSGISRTITESGFGEGSSLIICTGILSGYVETLFKMVSQLSGSAVSWLPYMLSVLGVFTVVTMWAVVVTEGCRKIKLQYYGFQLASASRHQWIWCTPLFTASIIFLKLSEAKELFFSSRGGSPINEVQPYIPININPSGMQPILCTSYLFAIPSILASLLGSPFWENVKEILNPQTSLGAEPWVFYSIYAFSVFAFNIIDIANVPKEICDYLNYMNARIPNVKPGKATLKHLAKIQASTRFWGGLLLTFLATTSTLLDHYLRRLNQGFSIGFTSVLIIVGSIIQLRRSYQAYNVMPSLTSALKRYGV